MSVQDGLPASKAGMEGIWEDQRRNIHLGDVIIAVDEEFLIVGEGHLAAAVLG